MKKILIITMILLVAGMQMAAGLTPEEGTGTESECSDYTECGDCGAIKLEGWEDTVDDSGTWGGITIDETSKFNFTWNSNGQGICAIVVKAGTDRYIYDIYGDNTGTIDINTMPDKNGNLENQNGISHVTFCYACDTEIPEFPTVAIPIASIIGLAFIMQRRKE